jgi:hypothetical protein
MAFPAIMHQNCFLNTLYSITCTFITGMSKTCLFPQIQVERLKHPDHSNYYIPEYISFAIPCKEL